MFRFPLAVAAMAAAVALAPLPTKASEFSDAMALHHAGRTGEAVVAFDALARSGHSAAQFNLALLHALGKGTPLDERAAYYWAWRARLSGEMTQSPLLIRKLAPRLPEDTRNAVADDLARDLQTMAEAGDLPALGDLALVEMNVREPSDPETALIYASVASAFDTPMAVRLREAIAGTLDDETRLKALSQVAPAFADWCARVPAESRAATCPAPAPEDAQAALDTAPDMQMADG